MSKILKIQFKNIESYGNAIQEIKFENKGNFYLLAAPNGYGKTTIANAFKFVIYGKLADKNLVDIPNRHNKNLWCKIWIEYAPNTVATIERGLMPNLFNVDIFKNGKKIKTRDDAKKKTTQNFIDNEIMGMPFYIFNNVISLSVNDFKSFLNMTNHDKRKIIDKIFNLEILNRIKEKIKLKMDVVDDELNLLTHEINLLENSIKTSTVELTKLNEKLKLTNKEKIKKLNENIESLKNKLKETDSKIIICKEKDSNFKSNLEKLNKLINNKKNILKEAERKEKLYLNNKCPTCESDLTTQEHKNIKNDWDDKKNESNEKIKLLTEQYNNITKTSNKINDAYYKLLELKSSINTKLEYINNQIKEISGVKNKEEQTKSLKNIITSSEKNKATTTNNKIKKEKQLNFYEILSGIFGDEGVKRNIIKSIIPSLNTEINNIINELGLRYTVKFDENFDSKITELGYDVSVQQLSTGQRKKIDFAVLIALIKLMKIKFHGMNLLFLDEIFSSVDADGIYQILKILRVICEEQNMNIFVVNHSPLPVELFDKDIKINFNDGFSDLEVLNLN